MEKELHPRNIHNNGYDFEELSEAFPKLKEHLVVNDYGNTSINFSKAASVKILNQAILAKDYDIQHWKFPETNLCPPIPGRVDYVHYLADLIGNKSNVKILDIGTGANCIYPLLGFRVYNWKFTACDVDKKSIFTAKKIVSKNELGDSIQFKHQSNSNHILKGIIKGDDHFEASMCNPPFFVNQKEADSQNQRKNKNLKIESTERNFKGTSNELIYPGGEKAFVNNYIYESSLFKEKCNWFTSLISQKENLKGFEQSLIKLKAKEVKIIPMSQGQKVTRILAWKF